MRRVAVVTGSRAEFGLLSPLLRLLDEAPDFSLQLVVAGGHHDRALGYSRDEIVGAGFSIAADVVHPVIHDGDVGVAHATGRALTALVEAFERLAPDLVLVLGDRWEIFAAASAAHLMRIPVAHLHGGERTDGAIDDALRHAISKLSHLHFAAAAPYCLRLRQLGEPPDRVHNVGAVGLDGLQAIAQPSPEALRAALRLPPDSSYYLVTWHAETLSGTAPVQQVQLLAAALLETPHALVVTGSNADAGGLAINAAWEELAERFPGRIRYTASLGMVRYVQAVRGAHAVVGNSSSGLIEVPSLGTPTLNLGVRQAGRLSASSVLHAPLTPDAVRAALATIDDAAARAALLRDVQHPYGAGGASARVLAILRATDFGRLFAKSFVDL